MRVIIINRIKPIVFSVILQGVNHEKNNPSFNW
jgi:hypothetical protein